MLLASLCRRGLAAGIVALAAMAGSARAQGAWVGDPKSLTADLAYHYVPSTTVVISPDMDIPDRTTKNHIITLGVEYVPIENLSIEASLPLQTSKYTGTAKHLPPGEWDDGSYHTALTDFRVGARYQVLDEPILAISPHIAFSIPVMDYAVNGFATGGRHLKYAHVGASFGRTLNPYVPNLFLMATYEFSLGEKYDANAETKQIGQNRSDIDAQLGYLFLDGDLGVNFGVTWRIPHGGVEFKDFAMLSQDIVSNHDPILKEEYLFLGAGVTYAINPKLSVGAVVRRFLRGYNTRDQSLYGIDITWRAL